MHSKYLKQHETSSSHTAPAMDRRSASRVLTVLRVGRIIAERDQGLARVMDISDRGARLRLQIPIMLGDALTLELADNFEMTGHVVWTAGNNCGLRFDQYVDCSELLAELATCKRRGTSRSVRLPVVTSAMTRSENGLRLVKVADISQRGMKLKHDGSFSEGLRVKITLPGGLTRWGVVRWSEGNIAGVMLLEPFSAEELGSARNL